MENTCEKPFLILIVEDDKSSQLLFTILLKGICSNIIIVENGKEAVKACIDNPDIDLVLMDIQLPEMNGYEATQQIRNFNKDVIIIVQTAYGLLGDRQKAIDAGSNDYISKPIERNAFMKLLRKYLLMQSILI